MTSDANCNKRARHQRDLTVGMSYLLLAGVTHGLRFKSKSQTSTSGSCPPFHVLRTVCVVSAAQEGRGKCSPNPVLGEGGKQQTQHNGEILLSQPGRLGS